MLRRDAFTGTLLLLASIGVLGGAGMLAYVNQQPERETGTLCAPKFENGQTIFVVDKTDLWNDAQANRLESHVWWLVTKKMRTEERLSIFTFSDEWRSGTAPIFSFCKPPTGEMADDIVKSKDYYNRLYKKQFVEPLNAALENIKKAEEKDCSPIIEALFDILTRREVVDHPGPTRLVLISDMAENSSLYSFYVRTKCFKPSTSGAPRQDTSKIESFIRNRAQAVNTKEMSAIVFQVFPAKNPPHIADETKRVWSQFFQYMKISAEWQLL